MHNSMMISYLTLAAIILGPIIAVLLTRWIDRRSDRKARRMSVFRDLMRTRGIRLDPTHVAALNLVELEFYGDKKVRAAFKQYITHLSDPMPENSDAQDRFIARRSDLFAELLFELGTVLEYNFDKRDLDRHSYAPRGWDVDESLQRRNAQLLNSILDGHRPIPVTNFFTANSPFPAPPKSE